MAHVIEDISITFADRNILQRMFYLNIYIYIYTIRTEKICYYVFLLAVAINFNCFMSSLSTCKH